MYTIYRKQMEIPNDRKQNKCIYSQQHCVTFGLYCSIKNTHNVTYTLHKYAALRSQIILKQHFCLRSHSRSYSYRFVQYDFMFCPCFIWFFVHVFCVYITVFLSCVNKSNIWIYYKRKEWEAEKGEGKKKSPWRRVSSSRNQNQIHSENHMLLYAYRMRDYCVLRILSN